MTSINNNKTSTTIMSCFPGCGKTWCYKYQGKLGYTVFDSDSSKFQKYDGWEVEYVDSIEVLIGKRDFIFICQYPEVLKELKKRNISFFIVAPENYKWTDEKEKQLIKQQWFGRFLLRDNNHIKNLNEWLQLLEDHYDDWTDFDRLLSFQPDSIFLLKENQYLNDIIKSHSL